jgi:hypothetical protein
LEERRSSRSPWWVKFCQPNPPGPKFGSTASNPWVSYRVRVSGLARTSYASEISLNRSSATFGFSFATSGWYWRASRR